MNDESITKTFKIPISYLDYDYIKNCTNVTDLEKIYLTLKTGEEGVYPDLEKFCEEHLRKLSPNSRTLRKATELYTLNQLDASMKEEIISDFQSWVDDIQTVDKSLSKSKPSNNCDGTFQNFPIRSKQEISLNNTENNTTKSSNRSCKPKDYNEWSKIADMLEKQMILEEKEELAKPKTETNEIKKVHKNEKLLPLKLNIENMSQVEKDRVAVIEKEKGNEAFKAGDLPEAVIYYTRSLSVLPIDAVYNNRGLVYMKQKKWEEAIRDLSVVLKNDPENIKALQRRATCYSEIHNLSDAIIDCRKILQLNPSNKCAENILSTSLSELELRNKPKLKDGKRMIITEIGSDEESSDECEELESTKENFIEQQRAVEEKKQEEKIPIFGSAEEISTQNESEQEFMKLKDYGNQLFKELKYEEALHIYDKLVEKWSSNPIGYRNRAACNLVLQRSTDVIIDCTKAIELDKDSHLSYYRRGKAYKILKMYENSYNDLEMALKLSPGHNQIKDEYNEVKILLQEENISRYPTFSRESTENDSNILSASTQLVNSINARIETESKPNDIDDHEELTQETSGTWEFLALPESGVCASISTVSDPVVILKKSTTAKMTKFEFDKQLNNIRLQADWIPTIQLLLDAGAANLSSLIGTKLDGFILEKIISALLEYSKCEDNILFIKTILQELTKVERFCFIKMMISDHALSEVDLIFQFLKKNSNNLTEIDWLQQSYH